MLESFSKLYQSCSCMRLLYLDKYIDCPIVEAVL